eukprot:TRINITY_DN2849_c0_g1_i2.p1 TRINITY_DN2849_c0_g1~~TRINITY_DN2849_c0_g1_i2.p1  ORF type:complete len:108 (-),score=13.92 TRINITY_DN2849_c0_g1_i2:143-466(-)
MRGGAPKRSVLPHTHASSSPTSSSRFGLASWLGLAISLWLFCFALYLYYHAETAHSQNNMDEQLNDVKSRIRVLEYSIKDANADIKILEKLRNRLRASGDLPTTTEV